MQKANKIKLQKDEILQLKIQKLLKGQSLPTAHWILMQVGQYVDTKAIVN